MTTANDLAVRRALEPQKRLSNGVGSFSAHLFIAYHELPSFRQARFGASLIRRIPRSSRWAALQTMLPTVENIGKFDPENGERRSGRSQPIQNLVSPETLKPVQRLVKRDQLIKTEAADLLDRAYVLLVERINDVAYLATFAGQLDAHRAPIEAGALVVEKANLGELLEVVGDV
jgi:hypothetical protein